MPRPAPSEANLPASNTPVDAQGHETIHDQPIAGATAASAGAPFAPSYRWNTRRRNQICLLTIMFGLLNFVVFTLGYAALGGDAHNGRVAVTQLADGTTQRAYFIRGHFLRTREGREAEVPFAAWVYSYIHSITVWITSAAVIISMLILARPHIIATMRGSWLDGRTFTTVFVTVVLLATTLVVTRFIYDFIVDLSVA